MPFPRASGILLHPTSLPSRLGIGDLGVAAYDFVDFLADTRQQLWQVLPLGPTGHGNSPYMCYSSMAGNPLLISLEKLCEDDLLYPDELHDLEHSAADWVDFDAVIPVKMRLLERAASRFRDVATEEDLADFEAFCAEFHFWLEEFAFFMALKNAFGGASWTEWDEPIARREPAPQKCLWRGQLDGVG